MLMKVQISLNTFNHDEGFIKKKPDCKHVEFMYWTETAENIQDVSSISKNSRQTCYSLTNSINSWPTKPENKFQYLKTSNLIEKGLEV